LVVPFYYAGLITNIDMVKSMPEHHSILGLGISFPFLLILGVNGIVPSLISSSVLLFLLSLYLFRKLKIKHIKLTLKQLWNESKGLLVFGIPLMLSTLSSLLATYIIKIYICQFKIST